MKNSFISVYKQPPNQPKRQRFINVLPSDERLTAQHLQAWGLDPSTVIDFTLRDAKPRYWLVVVRDEDGHF